MCNMVSSFNKKTMPNISGKAQIDIFYIWLPGLNLKTQWAESYLVTYNAINTMLVMIHHQQGNPKFSSIAINARTCLACLLGHKLTLDKWNLNLEFIFHQCGFYWRPKDKGFPSNLVKSLENYHLISIWFPFHLTYL